MSSSPARRSAIICCGTWDSTPCQTRGGCTCYTHVHLFTKEHWDRCLRVKNATRHWQTDLDDMGADFLVLEDELYEQTQRGEQQQRRPASPT